MRQQQPECFVEQNTVACSSIDGQHTTSEGEDERENAEDPMFISVEDELIEIVQELDLIDKQSPIPATGEPTIPPVTTTTHKHRHEHKASDELFVK